MCWIIVIILIVVIILSRSVSTVTTGGADSGYITAQFDTLRRRKNIKGAIVQYYYTKTCPYCIAFDPIWNVVTNKSSVFFKKVNQNECNCPDVKTVPAIYKQVAAGEPAIKFTGPRTVDSLLEWIKNDH